MGLRDTLMVFLTVLSVLEPSARPALNPCLTARLTTPTFVATLAPKTANGSKESTRVFIVT